jgi:YVTN family beta-propeller protein
MNTLGSVVVLVLLSGSCHMTSSTPSPARAALADSRVRIPIERVVPDAVFQVPGAPDWIAVDDDVWISNEPKNSVTRLDPKSNQVVAAIQVGKEPSCGLVAGFGSLWVPNCGDSTMSRIDLRTGRVTATFPMTFADSEGGIAAGAGSVWVVSDSKSTLVRIDPSTNRIAASIAVAPGSTAVAFGENDAFVSGTRTSVLTRVDPRTNTVVATIPVGPAPRFLAIGEGSVWTLNQGDGSVSRVDLATNRVVATIGAEVSGGGGEIAVGDGSVWVTMPKFPITRIDPQTNRVAQQFFGPGGDAIRVGHGSVWLSNSHQHNVWRIDPRRIEALKPG